MVILCLRKMFWSKGFLKFDGRALNDVLEEFSFDKLGLLFDWKSVHIRYSVANTDNGNEEHTETLIYGTESRVTVWLCFFDCYPIRFPSRAMI